MCQDLNSPIPGPHLDGLISSDGRLHPTGPMWPDPLLDELEFQIENQTPVEPLPVELEDPMQDALDMVERHIESEPESQKKASIPDEPIEPGLIPCDESSRPVAGTHNPAPESPPPPTEELSPVREYPYPQHRMHGGSTGIRNQGSDMRYCWLHDSWIRLQDCENCSDYEAGDAEEDICRYVS
jgi:hypothetical protein